MVRDTPCIESKVAESKTRDESNTILHKSFPGGLIYITGANSPIGLRRSTIRVLLLDEVDGYPPSAGVEGDPVKLAKKRTVTFWNRKIIETSTPTIKGISRIEASWEESDQRYFHVPCPRCGMFQVLHWGQVKFDKNNLSTVHYECEHCQDGLTEADKFAMIRQGRWIPRHPERGRHAGFFINELYSPWSTWRLMVEEFLEAKKRPEALKVWVNTSLGETWKEEESYSIDNEKLATRIEHYEDLPDGVILLTASVDVQDDRLECLVKGWGLEDESWFIDLKVFYGSPAQGEVWNMLDIFLKGKWKHELGGSSVLSPFVSIAADTSPECLRAHEGKSRMEILRREGIGGWKTFIGKVRTTVRASLIPLGVDTGKNSSMPGRDRRSGSRLYATVKCDEDISTS
jgi:phage terminase large subunit GpA-like protein